MQKEEIDWINNPHSLVGERIQVLWKGGKKYGGLVKKYSITSKIFTGQYDDGEGKKRQCNTIKSYMFILSCLILSAITPHTSSMMMMSCAVSHPSLYSREILRLV